MLIAIVQSQPYAIVLSGDARTRIGALQFFRGQFFEHIFCNEDTVLDPQAHGRRPADVPPTRTVRPNGRTTAAFFLKTWNPPLPPTKRNTHTPIDVVMCVCHPANADDEVYTLPPRGETPGKGSAVGRGIPVEGAAAPGGHRAAAPLDGLHHSGEPPAGW